MSDLHVEFGDVELYDNVECDVVVLAGDIDVLVRRNVAKWARTTFPSRDIVWVPGNHEYYRSNEMLRALRYARGHAKRYGVHLLEKNVIELHGARFLGTTLWTDFNLQGDSMQALRIADRRMNDFRLIRIAHGHDIVRFTPEDTVALHKGSLAWLERMLAEPFSGPTVVVTHHAPHPGCSHPRFRGDALSPAYCSDLGWLIEKHSPSTWIWGHTHHSCQFMIGKTLMVSNQRGYSNTPEDGAGAFTPELVIEL